MPSNRSIPLFGRIRLPVGLRWMVLAWIVAETVVFFALVHAIGLGGTLLLGLGTTVLGIALLRRIGVDTMRTMRATMTGGVPPSGMLPDGLLAAFGAILLIVPGFVANAVGLALTAPSTRLALIRRFGAPDLARMQRPRRTDVIDLGPSDWTPIDRV